VSTVPHLPCRPRRFTVFLTAEQGTLIDQIAREFRASPGDLIAALAIGKIAPLDAEEAVEHVHTCLLEVIVEGRCPHQEFPLTNISTLGGGRESDG
jgi:hypothetical protein